LYNFRLLIINEKIAKKMQPPIDKNSLSNIVYEATIPNYNNLVDELKQKLSISGSHKKRNGH